MTPAKRILLVDDDDALRQSLAEHLHLREGFEIDEAATAADGLAKFRSRPYDAILLDVSLPDMDGHELCRMIRQEGMRGPVILLTGTEAGTTYNTESGASDYVTKPFRIGVLLSRLHAQLRQFEHNDDNAIVIGPYSFRPTTKVLLDERDSRKVRLTEKESAILIYLHRAVQKVVGRGELLGEVWGYGAAIATHTLETHIYRLRQKIEDDPAKARILITEPGGYRLVP
ncbi:MAG: response regulator transcription factor [Rhodospirillaceae bacterium]